MSDPPPADEPPVEPPRSAPPPKRSRFVRIAVLLAGLGLAALILPRVPRDREIEFRVEDPATIVAIDLAWSRDDAAREAIQGGSWRFAPGQAPRSLTTSVHLPNGRYAVDVTVERTEGRDELHRVIELADADHVTVPLR
ncbi:MAG: hypothetical protein ABJE95_23115 [Byssovorax sp.]